MYVYWYAWCHNTEAIYDRHLVVITSTQERADDIVSAAHEEWRIWLQEEKEGKDQGGHFFKHGVSAKPIDGECYLYVG